MMRLYLVFIVAILVACISCKNKNSESENIRTIELPDSIKIDSLTNLIIKNPKKADLYAERSDIQFRQGEINKAINDLLIANSLDSLNPDYYIKLADFYLQLGKSEVINKILMKGNHLIPDNKDILYRLGNLYFYIQDYKKAMAFLNHAKNIDPYFAEVYFTKALVLKEIGDTVRAVENLQIAVEREPNYYDAYVQLGLLYAIKSDSIALDYYDNAINIVPNSYDAYYGKAYFYQQNERPEEAIKIYNEMLRVLSNELPAVYHNLGYIEMVYYANYSDAIVYFDSSLMYSPVYPQAYYNKGYSYEQLNNFNEARKAYSKALEQAPNYDLAISGLNRLDKK